MAYLIKWIQKGKYKLQVCHNKIIILLVGKYFTLDIFFWRGKHFFELWHMMNIGPNKSWGRQNLFCVCHSLIIIEQDSVAQINMYTAEFSGSLISFFKRHNIVIRCNGVWWVNQELVGIHNDATHEELVKIYNRLTSQKS